MKKVLLGLLIFLVLLAVYGLFLQPEAPVEREESPRPAVAVSTFSLYDMLRYVGGEKIDLFMVVPFGVDVHGFEPTPKDLVRLTESALFVYSGAGLEPWAGAFAGKTKTLDVSTHVKLLQPHEEEHAHHEHDEGADPHYWLDIENMIAATRAVAKALSEVDPSSSRRFMRNAEIYITQLYMLDNRYKDVLKSCKQPMIVVNHNAFGYLSERYGFEVKALTGLSPEAMPSAKTMAQLSDLVREHRIKTVFFESFVSDRLVQSLAKESGAAVDVLQPLANITAEEAAAGISYFQLMEQNLKKLSDAMECR